MKRALSMLLASVLLVGILGACTPPQPQQEVAPPPSGNQAAPPPAGTTPTTPPAADPTPPQAEGPTGTLIIATANETPSIAPARHNAAAGWNKNVMTHNGLFRGHYEDLAVVPDLVASWTAISDVLFEFTLHEGVLFHNGEEMTAADVVASWYYVRNYPDTRTVHLSALAIEQTDRYVFTLYTGVPNASLFFDLTGQGNFIMPQSLIESGHDFQTDPIGTGPFVFEDWRLGDSLTFRAFEDYFDQDRFPSIETITWRIIPEAASRTIALETGEVDLVVEVAYADIPRLEAHPNVTVFTRPGPAFHHLVLNNSLPQFENIYARKAINMAIDQEAMVAVAFDGLALATRAQVPILFPGTTYEGVVPFDPEGARALLAEHNIDPASLGFEMIASTEERRRLAEVAQAQLLDIGIPTTIVMNDHATTLARMNDGNYEAGFGMWSASNLISVMRGVLHGGLHNRSRIYNAELDYLIDKAVATIDVDARDAIFEEASIIANRHVGNVPTHLALAIRAFNSDLRVPEISPTGALNLNVVYWAR